VRTKEVPSEVVRVTFFGVSRLLTYGLVG